MAFELELEYQHDDGALILKHENGGGRLLDFYETLNEACLKFSPDEDLGVAIRIRAWSLTGVSRN